MFEKLPFITGVFTREDYPVSLSTYLPFNIGFNAGTGCIILDSSVEVDQQLKLAYELGSMASTPLGQGTLNAPLSKEIIDLVDAACGGVQGKSFLEPGCGTGFLLKKLKEKGAKTVVGCEPGPQALLIDGDIKVHNLFFHQLDQENKFDCIYSYGVVEHIKDLESFLTDSLNLLKENGLFLAVVPGCREDLSKGNFMILAHEHYNYFTPESLKWFFMKAGLTDIKIDTLKFSAGIICASGRKTAAPKPFDTKGFEEHCKAETALLNVFMKKSKEALEFLQKRIQALEHAGKTIGLWGAPRSLPGLLEFKIAPRVFDSDAFKYGKYFAGSSNPVESPLNLLDKPVDEMWILPIHHDRAIRHTLEKEILSHRKMTILSMLDLMSSDSMKGAYDESIR